MVLSVHYYTTILMHHIFGCQKSCIVHVIVNKIFFFSFPKGLIAANFGTKCIKIAKVKEYKEFRLRFIIRNKSLIETEPNCKKSEIREKDFVNVYHHLSLLMLNLS